MPADSEISRSSDITLPAGTLALEGLPESNRELRSSVDSDFSSSGWRQSELLRLGQLESLAKVIVKDLRKSYRPFWVVLWSSALFNGFVIFDIATTNLTVRVYSTVSILLYITVNEVT